MLSAIQKKISITLITTLLVSVCSLAGSPAKPVLAAAGDSMTIALKSKYTQQYVSPAGNSDNGALKANSETPGSSELFQLIEQSNGSYAIEALSNGKYVNSGGSDDSAIVPNAGTIGSAEFYDLIYNSDGTISLKSRTHNKYVYVEDPQKPLKTTSASIYGDHEKFILNDFTKPFKILEIKDLEKSANEWSVVSDFSKLFGSNQAISLETMSIKKFVALREELDGKYDAVYFGKSLFNPTSETGSNHDTRFLENDMTSLKATEITEKYINKGLPVIVYSDDAAKRGAIYQGFLDSYNSDRWTQKKGNLYNLFNRYKTTPKSNVIFVNNSEIDSFAAFIQKTNLFAYANVRPRINVTSQPADYTLSANRSTKYRPGDTLTYTFDVSNVRNLNQRNLVANLYLGLDSVLKFDANHLVQSVPVTSLSNNTISFTLPKGYSGLYYWRLELVDQTTTGMLKDYAAGVFRYQDQPPTIHVLQVIPNSQSSAKTSSLLLDANLKQNYLKSEDYEIKISVIDFNTFNSTEYSTLNSKYDMIIFGFNDSYNGTANISETAAAAVKSYIATGQGVMFTHDTVYQGNQTWITNFQADTGQIGPKTNMGLNAPNTSTSTVKVNEGLLTEFPFFISERPTAVATTHDQYFRLDLNDPKVIPWYNINGSPRDVEDSWNHYYTYSKGNVTYSGTGHNFVNTTKNSSFPDWEQQLFVNTMYRAFIGSNHKPTLDILTPAPFSNSAKNYISAKSDISVSFRADDLDLTDKTTVSSIKFAYKNANNTEQTDTVLSNLEKPKGETVTRSFPNPLSGRGGDLTIIVTTADKSGALETKQVAVKVIVPTGLEPVRTVSSDRVEKNTNVTISYEIKPIAMNYNPEINVDDLTVKRIHYKETLPANLEVVTLPQGFTKSGTLQTGYTIDGSIEDIPFRRSGNQYIADSKTFAITVKPAANGDYALSDATLTFKDYSTTNDQSVLFTNRLITAYTRLTSLQLDDKIIALGDTTKLIPKFGPADASYARDTDYTWSSDAEAIATVDATGVVTAKAAGVANIQAVAKDGSGVQDTAKITVIMPGLNITGLNVASVNQPIELKSVLVKTPDETITSIAWSSSDNNIAAFGATDTPIASLTGIRPGQVTVTLTIKTDKPKTYTQTHVVNVISLLTSLDLEGETTLEIGDAPTLHAKYTPGYVTNPSFEWKSSNANVIEVTSSGVNSGALEGYAALHAKAEGEATITVRALDGSSLTDELHIQVIQPAITINSPITIHVGDVPSQLVVSNNFLHDEITSVKWERDDTNENFVRFSGEKQLERNMEGKSAGTVNGKVTVVYRGVSYTKDFTITVDNPVKAVTIVKKDDPNESDPNAVITVDKGASIDLRAVIQRPDAVHSGFQWFIIEETGNASLNSPNSQDVTLTGTEKGTIKVRVLVGGIDDTRDIKITQNLTRIDLPEGPIRLVLNTSKNSYDLWSETTVLPVKWREELKDRLEWVYDDNVVTINNGVVTGTKVGDISVTLRYKDDPSVSDSVRVIVQKQYDNRY
ncbi:DUF5057 domain-containing protein [Paenibacillus sp. GCM10023248]|uniref:DUF5057 domain-containing protein n=1 Tax=unclassified Paenibacillus TaxID=185978 RepID=UPI00237920A8|nr:DUF5057 domain-containing protein [Paenibacillus sp. MAHUQ-63]MDD9267821.1 DUF5057 domain-containing protein [Paenibacillus sp. MAHUQ-63]